MPYTEEEEEEGEGRKTVLGAYKGISCQVQRQLQLFYDPPPRSARSVKTKVTPDWMDEFGIWPAINPKSWRVKMEKLRWP